MKDVLEWPTPKCVKDVQKFLGLANFYHRFIEGFASIVRPFARYGEEGQEVGMDGKNKKRHLNY